MLPCLLELLLHESLWREYPALHEWSDDWFAVKILLLLPIVYLPKIALMLYVDKLKIEINCREHLSKFELVNKEFEIKSGWYSGNCSVVTYRINELLGTKLRALYQRKKGRDLFDIWHILENKETKSQEILEAYYHYLDLSKTKISKKQFINNIEKKITDPEFIKDIAGLLRPDISFNFEKCWETIKVNLIERMDR